MKRTTLVLMGTVAVLLSACGQGPGQSTQTRTTDAPSPSTEIPDYSSTDLTKLLPTRDELKQRMGSGWSVSGAPEASKYQDIPLLGLSKINSGTPNTGSSECRKDAATGPAGKWADAAQIGGTNPTRNDFAIALLRFNTVDEAAAYAAGVKNVVSACAKEGGLDPSIAATFPYRIVPSQFDSAVSVETPSTSGVERYALLPHGSLTVLVTSTDGPGSSSPVDALLKSELDKLTGTPSS